MYNATYSIGSKSKSSLSRKKKENRKKSEHRKKTASEHRKQRACIILQSLGGSPVDWEYNPEIFGIPQIDNIDQEQEIRPLLPRDIITVYITYGQILSEGLAFL